MQVPELNQLDVSCSPEEQSSEEKKVNVSKMKGSQVTPIDESTVICNEYKFKERDGELSITSDKKKKSNITMKKVDRAQYGLY